jgi:putative oxidoreductase
MLKKLPEIVSRITIGYVFIESGIGKFQNLPKVVSYFESLKIPLASIQAPMVSSFELIFGLFVLIGFFTRLSSLPLIGIMTVAILTAKLEDITSFSSLLGVSEFLYIVILLWLATHGSEALSVDQWRARKTGSGRAKSKK